MADTTDSPTDKTTLAQRLFAPANRLTWVAAIALLIVLSVWVAYTPEGLLGKADAIGYAVCHRIEIRSFLFTNGRQLPLCARCSGTFLAVLAGFFAPGLLFKKRHAGRFPPLPIILTLLFMSGLWAFDGANSYTFLLQGLNLPHLYTPSNPLRLLTGTAHGITMGSLILPVVNSIIWKNVADEAPVGKWRELLVLLAIGGVIDVMILSGLDVLLYPLAILSGLGVVAILSAINTVLTATLLRRENAALRLAEALPMILFGLTLTFIMIGAIDFMRFILTGTWDGFIKPPV